MKSKLLLVSIAILVAAVVGGIICMEEGEQPAKRQRLMEEPSQVLPLMTQTMIQLVDNMSTKNLALAKEKMPADVFMQIIPAVAKSIAQAIKDGDAKRLQAHRELFEFEKQLLAEVGRQYYLLYGDPTVEPEDRYLDTGVDYGFSIGELAAHNKIRIDIDWRPAGPGRSPAFVQVLKVDLPKSRVNSLDGIKLLQSDIAFFDLSNNMIREIPDQAFKSFGKLREVNLALNFIEEIPNKDLFSSTDLYIFLNGNKLTSLNFIEQFAVTGGGVTIQCIRNRIEELPENINDILRKIVTHNKNFTLYLNGNMLSYGENVKDDVDQDLLSLFQLEQDPEVNIIRFERAQQPG